MVGIFDYRYEFTQRMSWGVDVLGRELEIHCTKTGASPLALITADSRDYLPPQVASERCKAALETRMIEGVITQRERVVVKANCKRAFAGVRIFL